MSFPRGALALVAFLKVIFEIDDHFLCQDLCAGVSGDVGIRAAVHRHLSRRMARLNRPPHLKEDILDEARVLVRAMLCSRV